MPVWFSWCLIYSGMYALPGLSPHLITLQIYMLSIKLRPSMAKPYYRVQHKSVLSLRGPCFHCVQCRAQTTTDEQIVTIGLLCTEHWRSPGTAQKLLGSWHLLVLKIEESKLLFKIHKVFKILAPMRKSWSLTRRKTHGAANEALSTRRSKGSSRSVGVEKVVCVFPWGMGSPMRFGLRGILRLVSFK